MENWERNFRILWFGSLLTDMGNAMTLPFMILYIDTLGNFTRSQSNMFGALAFSLTYLFKALAAPLWGKLADQKGRKLMCLRASGVMTLTILLVGLSPNVWFVLLFRSLQGIFSGYINNANALISTSVPKYIRGKTMSKLVTGSISGTLFGPVIGGLLAAFMGYREIFFVTSICMAIVFLTTLIWVKEDFTPIKKTDLLPLIPEMNRIGWGFFAALLTSFLAIQATIASVTPMIGLLVEELLPTGYNLSITTGVVASMPGLATILMAGSVGNILDKIGAPKSLLIFMGFAIICLFITSMIQNIWQLAIFRLLVGITDAALLPALQVMTVQMVPNFIFGRIFSFNQSAQSMGSVIGPICAALISSGFGYKAIFVFGALVELVALLVWVLYYRLHTQRQTS
ncbi:MFS transporter [Companilactobacillus keshanensis]|uniref:MFS transporter n=1 Tax=Companilactobacillus keshanensis TaxID=2486003 RepID=A0ABW4BWT8_9LACO|nr:MFS transporter [Companilactobacillus keshanensis]